MSKFPLIDTGRPLGGHLNIAQMLPLPANSPFGNLALKYMKILEILHHANGRIAAVLETHRLALTKRQEPHGLLGPLFHTQEEVIYWLRRAADELLCLDYVVAEWNSKGSCPTEVKMDSIGRVLGDKDSLKPFSSCETFFTTLNEVSNAYKHSFINSQLNMMGAAEPVVFAVGLKENNLKNSAKIHEVELAEIVRGFNAFFSLVKGRLKSSTLPHLEPGDAWVAPTN